MWHRGAAHRRIHLRDIRLRNNAGMDFPTCESTRKILRTESTFETTGDIKQVTCERCQRAARVRYSWAFGSK
jgi:hypothetical protein